MPRVILSETDLSKLAALSGPVSIADAAGRLLGTYVPGVTYDSEAYRRNPSPLTPEERERRLKQEGGMTLAEFWEGMRKKYPDEFK